MRAHVSRAARQHQRCVPRPGSLAPRAHLVVVGAGRDGGAVRRERRGRDIMRVALRAPRTSSMGQSVAARSRCRTRGVQRSGVQLGTASEARLQPQPLCLLT